MSRRTIACLATLLAATAAALGAAPARAIDPPVCSAALFVPTDGDAFVVEQPDSAPGAIFCTSESALDFDVATAPQHGSLTALAPNGTGGASFTYAPEPGYAGEDAFALEVDDGENPPVEVSVAVSVRDAANDAPECTATLFAPAAGIGYRVEAGEPVAGRVDCFDDEGDELTFALASPPADGTVDQIVADGPSSATFLYAPGETIGADGFALVADDGAATSAPAAIAVEVVEPTNQAPACSAELATTADASGAFEVEAGSSVGVVVVCDDADGDPLAFDIAEAPAHGALAPLVAAGNQGATTTYTPAPGYEGYDTFALAAADGVDPATLMTVRVRVVPERDDPPRCTLVMEEPPSSGRHRVEQGGTLAGRIDCADESPALDHLVAQPPQHGTVGAIGDDGSFAYTASATFTGPDSFALAASDGTHESAPIEVLVEIVPAVDDPPACAVALSAAPDEEGAYLVAASRPTRGRIVCTDDAPADLAFSLSAAPAHGTVGALVKESATTATFAYTPTNGHLGADAFAFAVADGVHGPALVPVAVSVVEQGPGAPLCNGRLHTPRTPGGGYEIEAGETVQGTISCLDPDGDELRFSVARAPAHGALGTLEAQESSARFTYTAGDETGIDEIELVAGDGGQSSDPVTLEIEIVAAYDAPPVCQIGLFAAPLASAAYAAENARPNAGIVSCVDDEGADLDFAVTRAPQHGALASFADGGTFATFDYVADAGYVGGDTATVSVSDPAGGTAMVTLTVEVSASPNTAPVCTATLQAPFTAGAYDVAAGASAAGEISCSDAESDAVTIAVVQSPARGSLSALTGGDGSRAFTFTAAEDTDGTDGFTLRATDALGAVANIQVPLRIAGAGGREPGGGDPGGREPGSGDTGGRAPGGGDPGGGHPGPGGGGAAGGGGAGAPDGSGGARQPAASLRALKLTPAKRGAGVRLTFATDGATTVKVVLRVSDRRKLVTAGRATKRFSRRGRQTLDVTLNAKATATLRRRRALALRVEITVSAAGHRPTTITRQLRLRARR